MNREEELIACLEAEIAKRDARIDHKDLAIVNLQSALASARNELAALKAQPSAGVAPDQDGSAAQKSFWAGFEASVCGFHNLNIRAAWNEFKASEQFKRLNPCRAQSVPDVLFDGFAVYSAIDAKARGRTSPENVSDTLDAAVRLIRAAAPSANHAEQNLDMVPGDQQKEPGDE